MAEKAGGDRGLAELERDLKFRIASGEFDGWIESGVHLYSTPPWYEPGFRIACLRLRKMGGDLATHARNLFNEEFGSLEARLTDARMGDRYRDDPVGREFAKIRTMVSRGTSQPERTFVQYALNAPSTPPDLETRVGPEPKSDVPEGEMRIEDEIRRRETLLNEYKAATGNPSNKRIYTAHNANIHKPEFYKWLKGTLSDRSQTFVNFERFLRERKQPVPRKK